MAQPAPLIVIPVRGGSKGLPGKNLRPVGGLSLTARAVRTARAACALLGGGRVVVDSDDEALLDEGRRWGAETPYRRPAELATDEATTDVVLAHALTRLGIAAGDPRPVVLLQATSPLVPPEHVAEAVRLFRRGPEAPVVSVTPAAHPPEWCLRYGADGVLRPLPGTDLGAGRRQALSGRVRISGAVYVASARQLLAREPLVQPGVSRGVLLPRSLAADVDDAVDLEIAEALLRPSPRPLELPGRTIGPGQPCFVIAEAGVNHNGDASLAHRLVDAAAAAGADAVKFQTFRTDAVVLADAPKAAYQRRTTDPEESQRDMLRALELPPAVFVELAAHARERGLTFLSTPFDEASASFLLELGVPLVKIGSGELTNLPFLRRVAAGGRPLILSTGMAEMIEVAAAVDAVRAAGAPAVALLQCTTRYPAAAEEANLRAMATLGRAFEVVVGYSDHTPGPATCLAAVALGAAIVEKHLTLDRHLPGPDHLASAEPDEFARLVERLRAVEAALGDGVKRPSPGELGNRDVARRSLVAAIDLPAGTVVDWPHLTARRPATGISPAQADRIVGRRTRRPLAAGTPLSWDDLEP
ncbi:MAG: N-acetylneuraminate synthase [Acidobacteria bacterium]|nr:MAG: N-acetylneuraminate synthase [Acidobacteriota bacterium]